ncbi:hypothetical protein Q1695_001992 [Nippostrongylus brasiliensis]|nr:hypothetical protein Q1695_001992 [Nippostrongylus brasiliensis]
MRLQTGESTHLRAVAIDHTQAWLGLTVVRSSVEGGALGAGALPRVTLTADQGHPYLLSLHALSAAACPARSLLGDALFPPRYVFVSVPLPVSLRPTNRSRARIGMEPHLMNFYLMLSVAVLVCLAVLVTALNLVQPPLRRFIKWYFPGEQDYEIMA